MKKNMTRLTVVLMALICTLTVILPGKVKASYQTTSPLSGNCVRIKYAVNGKYLDVPSEGLFNNGTQLQLWNKVDSRLQNQIFYMEDTGSGWKIYPMSAPDKVLEVRNSSHEACAEVAQWSDHTGACARWDILPRDDGTVSFRNRESGLLMNVCGGGDAANATKIIQYPEDNTDASHFQIMVMDYEDIRSACYEESPQSISDHIKYDPVSDVIGDVENTTGYHVWKDGRDYYPRREDKVFTGISYLDADSAMEYINEIPQAQRKEFKSALYSCDDGLAVYHYICFDGTHINRSDGSSAFQVTKKPYCVIRNWEKVDETPLPPEAEDGDWTYKFL